MSEIDKFIEFRNVVRKLRSKDGCPWDREQTHESLKPYLLEEAYEVLEAIDSEDESLLCEELGDILLHVVMHSTMAEEKNAFSMEDVIEGISNKMVRRHPHVFGEVEVSSVSEVWENWDKIKKTEKNKGEGDDAGSILDSVPQYLPALIRADKIQKRAARIGFDWDSVAGAWDKVHEELDEINEVINGDNNKEKLVEELGDLLFSIVNVTRKLEIDAEEALRLSISKFMKRFSYVEAELRDKGETLKHASVEELETLWDKAKEKLKKND